MIEEWAIWGLNWIIKQNLKVNKQDKVTEE
jgi:hypothetical protein